MSADDLLVLLEVARSGRFTRAAEALGLSHTTIARRIDSLERDLGSKVLVRAAVGWDLTPVGLQAVSTAERLDGVLRDLEAGAASEAVLEDVVRMSAPDAFSTLFAAPAATRLHRRHAGVSVEIVASTRRATMQRSGLDIEVVVGQPRVIRAEATRLGSYMLGLYGATDYLSDQGAPTSPEDLIQHGLVYFIPSMLHVDDLDVGRRFLPSMRDAVTSTNVFAHVAATRAGAGIGLLPTFLADEHADLTRVLVDEIAVPIDYWLVTRRENMRRPAVAGMVKELFDSFADEEVLGGARKPSR